MRGVTLVQIIVAIVILGFLAALALPLMAYSRERSRRAQCCNNIRQMVFAMNLYSDSPTNGGYFPTDAPTTGDPFAASGGAGSFGMLYRQYVSDLRIFRCPSDPAMGLIPPRVSRILPWPESGKRQSEVSSEMTSYAYDPGHSSKTPQFVVLLADKRSADGNSNNHGRSKGQCVAFGITSEFRDSVQSPLDEKGARSDPNIFVRNPELPRDEDSVLRP